MQDGRTGYTTQNHQSGFGIDPHELVARFGENKIQAIKYIREKTGLGLKEAKDIADAAYAGVSLEKSTGAPQQIDPRKLIAQFGDRKILAINYVREQTGLGLKEAKDIVDAAYATPEYPETKSVYTAPEEPYTGPEIQDKPTGRIFFVIGALIVIFAAVYYLFMK